MLWTWKTRRGLDRIHNALTGLTDLHLPASAHNNRDLVDSHPIDSTRSASGWILRRVDSLGQIVMSQLEHARSETLSEQRRAGVCLHITSLPGPYGIGEIGSAARRFVDTAADMNLRVWQVLPCGPTAYGDSPYQALSAFAGNELLIDTGDLLKDKLVTAEEAGALASLPEAETDYGALVPLKNALIERAAERFDTHASAAMQAARDEFQQAADADWLHDYALFRILKRQHDGRPWTEWQTDLVRREPEALRRIENQYPT